MNNDLAERQWHDANLLSVFIDRSNPGETDRIELLIEWNDETRSTVIFCDCYLFQCTMNFNIVAKESILAFDIFFDDPTLTDLKSEWASFGERVESLRCHVIETSSTASVLKIYSLGAYIEDCD
jgi:hypothetical protein